MFEEDQQQTNQSSTPNQSLPVTPQPASPVQPSPTPSEPTLTSGQDAILPQIEPMVSELEIPESLSNPSVFSEPPPIQPETSDLNLADIASIPPVPPPVPVAEKPVPRITQFDTPEIAKKGIIEEASKTGGSTEEELYTMSDKFRKIKSKAGVSGKKGKKLNFLITALFVILIIIGMAIFYFWTRGYFSKTEPESESVAEVKQPDKKTDQPEVPVEEPEENLVFLEKTLIKELKDESGEVISSAEFYLPEGAIDPDIEINMDGNPLADSELKYEEDYKIIGGLYKFSIQSALNGETGGNTELNFKKPCSLKIFYNQDLIEENWKQYLTIGYFKDNIWTSVPSSFGEDKTELTAVDLEYLPADTWAIIIEKTKTLPKIETFQIAPNTPASADTDRDGLTDIEEGIFKTEINNPDSDMDGNPDGQEIISLEDPSQVNGAKLAASGLINVYTNPTYSYSFFYPASWLARAIPETDNQEVLVITNTGEFFSATVENNPEGLSPKDWYLRQSPHTDESLLYSTLVNNQEAVWNQEHLTIYINKDDRVYILSYNVGTEEEANFKTTFEMLINSFQFVIQSQGRPDGTLIKYPDQPGIYLIESNKKRAFASGEIFEKLGFKWEEVIEIPYSETYIDGELITGWLNGTLIKYPDQPGIYLIQGGSKRAFASGEIFEKLGFKWEEVIEIPSDEIYPDGPIIDSNATTSQVQ